MGFFVVRDGNAFYEIDEDCLKRKKEEEKQKNREQNRNGMKKESRRKMPEDK